MDWAAYRALCERPDYWSRWMLEQSIELLELAERRELKVLLEAALAAEPLPRPGDHRGDERLNMHRLSCPVDQRLEIVEIVAAAKRAGTTTSGTRERGLRGFEEAWREYSTFSG